jgi:hypothetical protein
MNGKQTRALQETPASTADFLVAAKKRMSRGSVESRLKTSTFVRTMVPLSDALDRLVSLITGRSTSFASRPSLSRRLRQVQPAV